MNPFQFRAGRGVGQSGRAAIAATRPAALKGRWAKKGPTEQLAWKGAVWTFLSFGGSQAVRLAGSLVTTRLLLPEHFGLMAIVFSIIVGLTMFSDVGLSTSVIRDRRGEDCRFLNTVFTIQAVRGLGLWLLCLAVAPFVADFYSDRRLLWVLPVVGVTAVLSGLQSTSLLVLRRRMAVRQVTLLELGSQVVTAAVVVSWAALDPTVAALVAGPIAGSMFMLVASHVISERRDRFGFDRAEAIGLLTFGRWIFISTVFTFLASQTDRLILGKLFPLQFLGIYNIALMLSDVPRSLMMALSNKVIFPGFARLRDTPLAEMREKIGRLRPLLLGLSAIGLALLIGCGDVVVQMLYDPRWAAAGWMLPILAAGLWPGMLIWTLASIFFIVDKAHVTALATALRFAALASFVVIGTDFGGELGAVSGIALSILPEYIVMMIALRREGLAFHRQDAFATALFVGLASAIILARVALGYSPPVLSVLGVLP